MTRLDRDGFDGLWGPAPLASMTTTPPAGSSPNAAPSVTQAPVAALSAVETSVAVPSVAPAVVAAPAVIAAPAVVQTSDAEMATPERAAAAPSSPPAELSAPASHRAPPEPATMETPVTAQLPRPRSRHLTLPEQLDARHLVVCAAFGVATSILLAAVVPALRKPARMASRAAVGQAASVVARTVSAAPRAPGVVVAPALAASSPAVAAPPLTPTSWVWPAAFHTGCSRSYEHDAAAIDELIRTLQERCPRGPIAVTGHACALGDDTSNRRLSFLRAERVGDVLVRHGIEAARITVAGAGSSQPRADNRTLEGRQQNRRVTIDCGALR